MNVTYHAMQRIKERVGLPKRTVQRTAKKAFEDGLSYIHTKGNLRNYFEYLYKKTLKTPNIRIYGEFVYLFSKDNVLITVFGLPPQYKKEVKKMLKKRNQWCIE